MTQRELADKIEMDYGYLSRIENDRPNHLPSIGTIEDIASHLGLTVNESDELCVLANKIPADVREIILSKPKVMAKIRKFA